MWQLLPDRGYCRTWKLGTLASLLSILLALPALAQTTCAGFPNVAYSASRVGELLSDDNGYQEPTIAGVGAPPVGGFSILVGRTALIAPLAGCLVIGSEQPESEPWAQLGQYVWDISDPTRPRQVNFFPFNHHSFSAHGWGRQGPNLYLGGVFRRGSNGAVERIAASRTDSLNIVRGFGGGSRGGMFAGWNADFLWTYNTISDPVALTEQENGSNRVTHASFNHMAQTGMAGSFPFILGNILIYAGDESDSGLASYDISNPAQPVLLDVLNTDFGIGGYWPNLWENYLVFTRRKASGGKDGTLLFVDVRDPTDLKFVGQFGADGNPMYPHFKDSIGIMERGVYNMAPLRSGQLPSLMFQFNEDGIRMDTSQYAMTAGNLAITGGLDGRLGGDPTRARWNGAAIWILQAARDTTGPAIAYQWPKNGETNYPRTAPITLLIHEELVTENLENGRTFMVRPRAGGPALAGDLVLTSDDILSFNPYGNFSPGVEYEILITNDAFTDVVGNPIQDTTGAADGFAFRSTFTTENGTNPRPIIDSFTSNPTSPVPPGTALRLNLTAHDTDNLEYRIIFGDGDPRRNLPSRTAWIAATTSVSAEQTHTYTTPGTYQVKAQVRERGSLTRLTTATLNLVVSDTAPPPPPPPPPPRSRLSVS